MKKYICFILLLLLCFFIGCNATQYTINYDLDGGTCELLVSKYQEGEIIVLPEPSKKGYNFLGWYQDEIKVEFVKKGNFDLVAKWEKIATKYTITYDLDGGTCDKLITEYTEGDVVVLPTPIKEGFTFEGWYDGNQKVTLVTTGNLNLVAKYKKISEIQETIKFTIYAVNDFHGMIFEDDNGAGISKLGNYLSNLNKETSIILSAGDMFQGTAVSSMSRGKVIVDAMNYIGFDAMTIGNHEFDWGDKEIIKFVDGDNSNGEAQFPLLAANITDKSTGELASFAKPYAVFEKMGVKIGVIGIIGEDQESDILASYVKNYSFDDELTAIKKYTKILRTTENCDIVIASCHTDTKSINSSIASLSGDYYVDAVINGHTHQQYYGEEGRSNGVALPFVQSGCYGRYLGMITLEYNTVSKKVTATNASTVRAKAACISENKDINQILSSYQEYIDISLEKLGVSGMYLSKTKGGYWAASVLREAYNGDLGIVNTGGIRSNGFPIESGDTITYGDIFEIMPFENMVRIVELRGDVIINKLLAYGGSSYYISNNVNVDNKTINGVKIDSFKYYKVITIDYLFEQTNKPFLSGQNRVDTNDTFRDVLAQAVRDNVKENGKFIWG